MIYLKQFEKFSKKEYLKNKKDKEYELIQSLGDEYILDIVKDGDFDGLKYILNTGYDLHECDASEELLTHALNNNQIEMFEYLLKSNYSEIGINSVNIPDIIGYDNHGGVSKNITNNMIEIFKLITKKGFNWITNNHNDIKLFLCKNFTERDDDNVVVWKSKLLETAVPFIDWFLENYPDQHEIVSDIILPEYLNKKYDYLKDTKNFNL